MTAVTSAIEAGSTHLLSNEQLLSALHLKSQEERKLTLEIIALLQEAERRSLHLEKGYGSLLEFCVKELKYAEATAYRHISAMWATKEIPQVKKALEEGTLNLSTVTQAQTFFRQERKYRDRTYTKAEKLSVFRELENKTKLEAEKILIAKSPDLPKPEFVRKVTETDTRITITVDQKLIDQLDEIKNKYSHINPNPSYAELIGLMANEILRIRKMKQDKALVKQLAASAQGSSSSLPSSLRPPTSSMPGTPSASATRSMLATPLSSSAISNSRRKASPPWRNSALSENPKGNVRSRYLPASLRHFIHIRDGGACTYIDPQTKKKCGSRFKLEIDHIKPFSMGGDSEPENLRLACRNHNQFYWKKLEAHSE